MAERTIIIGGGGTGLATAYDLTLQGLDVILFEKGEFTSGTTGRHHGQLHSGARYAVNDPEIGAECMRESTILRAIAPECIEYNQGLFIALNSEDRDYTGLFLDGCGRAGIPTNLVSAEEARGLEPALNPALKAAVKVPDGTIDAFRLPMSFLSSAVHEGAQAFNFTEVVNIDTKNGTIGGVHVKNLQTGEHSYYKADAVVNAAGPWAGTIASMADCSLKITPAPGTMIAINSRLCDMVISRLRPPGNGDILVPQRQHCIIGTTEWTTGEPDFVFPRDEDIDFLLDSGEAMVPGFRNQPVIAQWAAARPLVGEVEKDENAQTTESGPATRGLPRSFSVINHEENAHGFFTIIGGKATVLRAMAERCTDTVLDYFGRQRRMSTDSRRLLSWREFYRRGL